MPEPVVDGSNALNRAALRRRTGNTLATPRSVLDSWLLATNTPEMKYSGSMIAWMIGCAESSLRMKLAAAKDRQQNAAAPTATASTKAGTVAPGRWTP